MRQQSFADLLPFNECSSCVSLSLGLVPGQSKASDSALDSRETHAQSQSVSPSLEGQDSDQRGMAKIKTGRRVRYDRFIPERVGNDCHGLRPKCDAVKESCSQNSPLQMIYQQYLLLNGETEPVQGIASFHNHNRLRFGQNRSTQHILPKPWLAGLQFRDQLIGFKNKSRRVKKTPFKVLDAPALLDDFYLSLIDWSLQNLVAVGLATSVYLWNARNAQITKLCDLALPNFVTAVGYSPKQPLIAVGTQSGLLQLWDLEKQERVRSFGGHCQRVGVVAWGDGVLSSGSRDKDILHRDIRSQLSYVSRLSGHSQEVCGLKWSCDQQQLCSGGNDNQLLVWSAHSTKPHSCFKDHTAAVKAVAWSPHQHGLLASGGGTVDQSIKFRNTLTGETVGSWETGSQVCNLAWNQTVNQLVSSHGSPGNELGVWECGKMRRVASLTGHTDRVVYLAMSPDGSTAVTGSGDETLRFWQLFPSCKTSFPSQNTLDGPATVLR